MQSLLDTKTREQISTRIIDLDPNATAQWGRMNCYQMLKHCTLWEDMIFGDLHIRRIFIGRIIGPMVLRTLLKNEKPLARNTSTAPQLIAPQPSGDIIAQKQQWLHRLTQYADFKPTHFIHPFFGPMSAQQIGQMAYKHADHHLRQFGG